MGTSELVFDSEVLDSRVVDDTVCVFQSVHILGWDRLEQGSEGQVVLPGVAFVDYQAFRAAINQGTRTDFFLGDLSYKLNSDGNRR